MDTTITLGPRKFSLQATAVHHRLSTYSGHYTNFVKCSEKISYCNYSKITEYEMMDTKNSSIVYVIIIDWLRNQFWTSTWRVGVRSLPCRWHILSILLEAGRGISAENCG